MNIVLKLFGTELVKLHASVSSAEPDELEELREDLESERLNADALLDLLTKARTCLGALPGESAADAAKRVADWIEQVRATFGIDAKDPQLVLAKLREAASLLRLLDHAIQETVTTLGGDLSKDAVQLLAKLRMDELNQARTELAAALAEPVANAEERLRSVMTEARKLLGAAESETTFNAIKRVTTALESYRRPCSADAANVTITIREWTEVRELLGATDSEPTQDAIKRVVQERNSARAELAELRLPRANY